jgi:hypothetical protein
MRYSLNSGSFEARIAPLNGLDNGNSPFAQNEEVAPDSGAARAEIAKHKFQLARETVIHRHRTEYQGIGGPKVRCRHRRRNTRNRDRDADPADREKTAPPTRDHRLRPDDNDKVQRRTVRAEAASVEAATGSASGRGSAGDAADGDEGSHRSHATIFRDFFAPPRLASHRGHGPMSADAEPGAEPSPAELRDLRRLAACMLPASAEYGVPGADDPEIFADIVRSLGRDRSAVRDALARLRELAGGDFAGLDEAAADAVAMTLLGGGGPMMTALGRAVLQCYYRDDRVLHALGVEARPPYPEGRLLEAGDWSLLEAMRGRPRMWRDVDGTGD